MDALRRLKESGRRLILVTGPRAARPARVFPELDLFDLAVVENGALLYEPGTGRETPVAEPPPEAFVARLRERGVSPLSVGRSIVATWEPIETVVLEAIRELGLELQIIFNKGAVMVLPPGVNKASGLEAALRRAGPVAPQRRGRRRRRERPRLSCALRLRGRGRQRPAGGQGRRPTSSPRASAARASSS